MWWLDIAIVVVVLVGAYGFVVLARERTRNLSRHTDLTAEQLYPRFADGPVKRRRPYLRRGRSR